MKVPGGQLEEQIVRLIHNRTSCKLYKRMAAYEAA